MKTPRDILLEQHRSAQSKLDSIRRAALADTNEPTRAAVSLGDVLRSFRWHLAGMSAIWLFVLSLHANTSPASQRTASVPSEKIPSPHVMMVSLRENRRRLSEMIDAHPIDGARHELFLPKPRSEWRSPTLTA
jgi:hypothetical protein